MKVVYQARDGVTFDKRKWCLEYEDLLDKADRAISSIKFRSPNDYWVTNPIIQHEKKDIHKAWSEFLKVVKELVVWSGMYIDYHDPYSSDTDPVNKEEVILEILDKSIKENRNIYPVTLSGTWFGFDQIRRKFEAVNFDTGEEYIGSFGTSPDGRDCYLRMVKEEQEYYAESKDE
jgi:hypothetical protein